MFQKLSEAEKKRRREQRRIEKIYYEFNRERHRYTYDIPPLSPSQAKRMGLDAYWSICIHGHVAERKISVQACEICSKVNRSIRDSRIRGSVKISLSQTEKRRIFEIYRDARNATFSTGIEHHVDHIRPLAAGGIHHPDNLQIIKASENLSKGSTYLGARRRYSKKEKLSIAREFKNKLKINSQTKASDKNQKLKKDSIGNSIFSNFYLFFYSAIIIYIIYLALKK